MSEVHNPCIGDSLEDWLKEEGICEQATEYAIKRTIAEQLEQEIKRRRLTKTQAAIELKTSRSSLDNILDPKITSITLHTMIRVAKFLGKNLSVSIQ